MSFADSWYRASCALLLLTLHFSMFSFYLPLSFSLSLLLSLSLSLSSLSLSLYLCALFLSVVARHMSSDALYQIFSSWSILLFHTISFHSSYKIHQLFTDYLLRLPSSELLEKHLFRSRANRRLVCLQSNLRTVWVKHGVETDLQNWWLLVFKHPMGADNCLRIGVTLKVNWLKIGFEDGEVAKQYRTMGLVGQLVFTS